MISSQPILKIRRNFSRPSQKTVAAFANVPTTFLVDAMGGKGCLDYRIKPVDPTACNAAGVALTAHAGPGDNLALWAALDAAKPGDVLVVYTDHYTGVALTGDVFIGIARNRGVTALVTDGLIRDVKSVRALGLPVYCTGVSANSPNRTGPGTVGFPISIGGTPVASGDIIVGDLDGVVVVPSQEAETVLDRLREVTKRELEMETKIKDGLKDLPEFVRKLMASDQILEMD